MFQVLHNSLQICSPECELSNLSYPGYGILYNWYVATYNIGGTSIAPTGWHVPIDAELLTLRTFIDPIGGIITNVAGIALKENGYIHWQNSGNPIHEGLDTYGFTALGSGTRSVLFSNVMQLWGIWSRDQGATPTNGKLGVIVYNGQYFAAGNNETPKYAGYSIRCILDGVDPANPGFVKDIEGNFYPSIKIGTQVWMASNLKVTKYNDGTPIPEVQNDAAWAALTTGAYCWYNNTPS